jgi:N-carbamoylputrescine amidase
MKTMIAAVAQITSKDGEVLSNLKHASELVLQGIRKGAQLILFPEFMSQGYRLTDEIWDSAEPFDGPTTSWLRETALNNNIYIGSSFLELKNGHFYNTFVLASPAGNISGKVYKRQPSMWEAYFFKGEKGPQYIDTEIGRIGIGICFDNHTYENAIAIRESNIDLMLMPHSYCTPTVENKKISKDDIIRLNSLPGQVARLYNDWFRIPVILCNKSGSWDSPVPNAILGIPKDYRFPGRSMIIDSDGTIKVELGDEETIAEGQITLDPSKKRQSEIPKYSRYIYPGPPGREIIRLIEWRGRLSYQSSKIRKAKAGRQKP